MRNSSLASALAVLTCAFPSAAQMAGQSSVPLAEQPTADSPQGPSTPHRTAKGFQGAVRTGMIIPWGDATAAPGDALGARSSWQVPIIIDAGLKITKPVWLGLYAGVGFGVAASDERVDEACAGADASCSVFSLQLGLQAQYQFGASELYNPWISYGAGYEFVRQSFSAGRYEEATSASGISYAKVGVGVDYRGDIGFGPFFEATAGQFAGTSTEIDDEQVYEGPIDGGAWHGYLVFGLRVVMFP